MALINLMKMVDIILQLFTTEWSRKKLHKVKCTIILQLFDVESCGLHQNAQQRLLSANQCKIFVNGLNIL